MPCLFLCYKGSKLVVPGCVYKKIKYLAHVIEKPNLRIPNPQYLQLFFNNIQLMYTLCFLVASVKLKVYKKVVKFSFKQQKILGIRNS